MHNLLAFIKARYNQVYRALLLFSISCVFYSEAEAAPYRTSSNSYPQGENIGYGNELRTQIDVLRHHQKNHEDELRVFDEKFETIQSIVDSLRSQLQDTARTHKDNLDASSITWESKFNDLELTLKSATSDFRKLKEHANQSSSVLTQYQQRLSEMEKVAERQSQQIESLQSSLQSIGEFLTKENDNAPVVTTESKIYRVKPGDNLEKIASANQTTVKAIKDLNNLTTDRIKINQKLNLP